MVYVRHNLGIKYAQGIVEVVGELGASRLSVGLVSVESGRVVDGMCSNLDRELDFESSIR